MSDYEDLFTYNADTGDLIWKVRPPSHFKSKNAWSMWNTKYSSRAAGWKARTRRGGKPQAPQISVFGKLIYLHRIVWEMNRGPIPTGMVIDHVNRNPIDNRIQNLRLATLSDNARNCATRSRHGLKGITKTASGKWVAQITVNRRNIRIGSFLTKGLAAAAYAKEAIRYHGQFARF